MDDLELVRTHGDAPRLGFIALSAPSNGASIVVSE